MTRLKIAGTGSYLPGWVLHNDELAWRIPDTSDEWIVSHTGISSRHLATPEDSPSSMAIAAARRALEMSGVAPEEIGTVMLSTATPDFAPVPQTSSLVHRALGTVNAAAFDITAACCGFVFNLELAKGLVQNTNHQKPILIVATEMMSRVVDWRDRSTCVLFGDGAGAAVLVPDDAESGVIDTFMKVDSRGTELLRIDGGCRTPDSHFENSPFLLHMEGSQVFKFAIRAFPEVILGLLERNHLQVEDIDWIVPHQANYRIIRTSMSRIGIPLDKFYLNIDRVANTASASIPIALDEMNRAGMLKRGDKILTVGFGAGLTYGGNLIVW